jgi:hypothetical protein
MIAEFLQFLQLLRVYHWNTESYSRHVASGSLYEKMDSLVDQFIETYQGQFGRIRSRPFKLNVSVLSDKEAVQFLKTFANLLITMKVPSSDLQNIRDEMLGEVQRTIYLFSFTA